MFPWTNRDSNPGTPQCERGVIPLSPSAHTLVAGPSGAPRALVERPRDHSRTPRPDTSRPRAWRLKAERSAFVGVSAVELSKFELPPVGGEWPVQKEKAAEDVFLGRPLNQDSTSLSRGPRRQTALIEQPTRLF